ncbi:MAG: alkylmercury lyase [Egibacteraceae bacterium]
MAYVIRIELWSAPGCPNAPLVRQRLHDCLRRLGMREEIREHAGPDVPSPTVLIDGVDVMGRSAAAGPGCRLDLPTTDHIRAALKEAVRRSQSS